MYHVSLELSKSGARRARVAEKTEYERLVFRFRFDCELGEREKVSPTLVNLVHKCIKARKQKCFTEETGISGHPHFSGGVLSWHEVHPIERDYFREHWRYKEEASLPRRLKQSERRPQIASQILKRANR